MSDDVLLVPDDETPMYVASILPHHGSDIAQHDQCLQANSVWNVDLGSAPNAYQQLPEISKVKSYTLRQMCFRKQVYWCCS